MIYRNFFNKPEQGFIDTAGPETALPTSQERQNSNKTERCNIYYEISA